ncbi:MAG: flagellin, partial [Rhodobacter sp.]|nr:flagellin [Rhodobacter sp.]
SNANGAVPGTLTSLIEGDAIELTVGSSTGRYVVKKGDTNEELATGLRNALIQGGVNGSDFTLSASSGTLSITNNTNAAAAVSVAATRGEGGLAALNTIDVTSNAPAALDAIEGLLQTSINAAASFGSSQKRIDIQNEFVGNLTDSLKTGIGAMVDTDMEEASARLQALQVQQQLATQALSIANQQPQGLLSLFR